jgi:uncharacterized repeat protein (TIGR03803 family)
MKSKVQHPGWVCGMPWGASSGALALVTALGAAAVVAARSAETPQVETDSTLSTPQVGTYSLLYSFRGGSDGCDPAAGLVRDSAGNLYGTTSSAGQFRLGTVYKVTPSGKETVLHSFAGSDGEDPDIPSLTLDAAGNLYGTTPYGGEFGYGVVFKVMATGTETVLYNFSGGTDGSNPYGGVVRDSAGNLYGTIEGGASGFGGVFKLAAGGKESVLHSFDGFSTTDGAEPSGGLVRDSAGNLYGTTEIGGQFGYGTVFRVTPGGSERLLYSFAGYPSDGAFPFGGGLLRDTAGNLYGVTYYGGETGDGVVFKVGAAGAEKVLLNFDGGSGGGQPYDGLTRDSAGNLYGTTNLGGSAPCGYQGCGVLFKLSTTGKEMVLHNFAVSSTDGWHPLGGVVRDPAGNLYGTLSEGGASGCGAVFKFTP